MNKQFTPDLKLKAVNPFTPIIVKNNQKWLFFTKA